MRFCSIHFSRLLTLIIAIVAYSGALRAEQCNLNLIENVPNKIVINLYPEKISQIDEAKNSFEITYYLLYEYEVEKVPERDCFYSVEELPENMFLYFLE